MNKDAIIKFKDILKYPIHYSMELIQYCDPDGSFLLYQYGPYLIMNNDFTKYLNNKEFPNLDYTHKPLLRFMIDIGTLVKVENQNAKTMKEIIMKVICNLPSVDTEYSKITREIANGMLTELRRYQYENHVTESAMINYCPIVSYTTIIKKPEMTTETNVHEYFDKSFNGEVTDDMINDHLKKYIVEIMKEPKLFLSVDTHNEMYCLKDGEYESNISYDILSLYEKEKNPVSIYFLMVYMRYCIPKEIYGKTVESLINLNRTYNKIVKGDVVNISDVITQLSDINLPCDKSFIENIH